MAKNKTSLKGLPTIASAKAGEIVSMLLIGSLVAVTAGMALLSSVVVKNRQTVQTYADSNPNKCPITNADGSKIVTPCTHCVNGSCQINSSVYRSATDRECCDDDGTLGYGGCSSTGGVDSCTVTTREEPEFITCDTLNDSGCQFCGANAYNFKYKNKTYTWYKDGDFHGSMCKQYCAEGNKTLQDVENSLCPPKPQGNTISSTQTCSSMNESSCKDYSGSCRWIGQIQNQNFELAGCNKCVSLDDNRTDNGICNVYNAQTYCKGEAKIGNNWMDCPQICVINSTENSINEANDSSGCKNWCNQEFLPFMIKNNYCKYDNVNKKYQDGSNGDAIFFNQTFNTNNWTVRPAIRCNRCDNIINNKPLTNQTSGEYTDSWFCQGGTNVSVNYTPSGKTTWSDCNKCGQKLINMRLSGTFGVNSFLDSPEVGSHCKDYCNSQCSFSYLFNKWECDKDTAPDCDEVMKKNYISPTPPAKIITGYTCTKIGTPCQMITYNNNTSTGKFYNDNPEDIAKCNSDCSPGGYFSSHLNEIVKPSLGRVLTCSKNNTADCSLCIASNERWTDSTFCSQWVYEGHKVAFPQNVPVYHLPAPTATPTPIKRPDGYIDVPWGLTNLGPKFSCVVNESKTETINNVSGPYPKWCNNYGKCLGSVSNCVIKTCRDYNYSYVDKCNP